MSYCGIKGHVFVTDNGNLNGSVIDLNLEQIAIWLFDVGHIGKAVIDVIVPFIEQLSIFRAEVY